MRDRMPAHAVLGDGGAVHLPRGMPDRQGEHQVAGQGDLLNLRRGQGCDCIRPGRHRLSSGLQRIIPGRLRCAPRSFRVRLGLGGGRHFGVDLRGDLLADQTGDRRGRILDDLHSIRLGRLDTGQHASHHLLDRLPVLPGLRRLDTRLLSRSVRSLSISVDCGRDTGDRL